ncbi:MAG: amidophosphoribosyltransferase [Muribaculaceae bacterium]|nr:amidophosphoribosyltransferase [Muribaculaceae bacterium]
MEILKHECGVAMIRLRKPLSYYKKKYGSVTYALDRLYLLMEKQHNRGQEAAGIGVVKLNAAPGTEYVYRERALGTGAIDDIFAHVATKVPRNINELDIETVDAETPFIGQVYMGHLRYSTTGRSGLEYTHPFLRRNNWRSRALLLCGNFNMTNVEQIFEKIISTGQHPRLYSDTVLLLEQIGGAIDKENHRLYREYRDRMRDPELSRRIEDELDLSRVLKASAPLWDGGYNICGTTGSGSSFALRDPRGIRPGFYYIDDEIIVVASERPVIQTVFNVPFEEVQELMPGQALLIDNVGNPRLEQILEPQGNYRCSFERVYFSRGSDADIYRERKALGANVVPQILASIDNQYDTTVFSFIPNTAEVAFMGMTEELNRTFDRMRMEKIREMAAAGDLSEDNLTALLRRKVRVEKIAIKDIKLRTFIAEGSSRRDLAAHVYDVTYGSIRPGVDSLVVIDDSIVRGTTLMQSILRILDRLKPRRIIVVSSSPQVRYPDYYGIDLAHLEELAAFRAAVNLLRRTGREEVLHQVYRDCLEQLERPDSDMQNAVQGIYAPFTDKEISEEMARMLTPGDINAGVELIFQDLDGLHRACPDTPGDWYFSGNYPTPGGNRLVNRDYIDYYMRTMQA